MRTASVHPTSDAPLPSALIRAATTPLRVNSEVFWEVSASTYRFIWLALLLLNLAVCFHLLATIGVYIAVSLVPAFAFYASVFHLLLVKDYPLVVALYGLITLAYIVRISKFLYLSLRHQRLVLPASLTAPALPVPPSRNSMNPLGVCQPLGPTAAAAAGASATRSIKSKSRIFRRVRHHAFSTQGVCGARGVYFEVVAMMREVVEVAIQTVQAYLCSRQTTQFWVHATFAALIVANCFASPLLHRLGHATKLSESGAYRVSVLVVDLALDLVWFSAIPDLLVAPYVQSLFTNELVLHRDTFIVEGIMEMPAFSATSYPDLLMKLWSPASLYYTIRKIELLVRRAPHDERSVQHHVDSNRVSSRSTKPAPPSDIVVAAVKGIWMRARIERWLRLLLLCWGHAVLAVFIHANFVRSPACSAGCQFVLRPWLHAATDCDCAAFEIDCHALGITGTMSEIEQALTDANINPRGLMNLIIAHCPMLHVPPAIGMLRDLYGLVIFNCSLVSWHPDAWITSARHPNLGRVQLIHTFIADVPQAILHANLPPRLLEIDIVASNLSSLPDDVAVFWSHLNTLLLDHGRFREFPSVLSRMPALETLSLYNNQITHIPDDALAGNTALHFFLVTLNPLQSLPSSLASCRELVDVYAMWTDVDDFATSLASANADTRSRVKVFGWASPACATDVAGRETRAIPSATWTQCAETFFLYNGVKTYSYYPLEAKLLEKQPQ